MNRRRNRAILWSEQHQNIPPLAQTQMTKPIKEVDCGSLWLFPTNQRYEQAQIHQTRFPKKKEKNKKLKTKLDACGI